MRSILRGHRSFASVVVSDGRVVLDKLWVSPELIGRGIGRQKCTHVFGSGAIGLARAVADRLKARSRVRARRSDTDDLFATSPIEMI